MAVNGHQLIENFPHLLEPIAGNLDTEATFPSGAELPREGSIVFSNQKNWISRAFENKAKIIVVPKEFAEMAQELHSDQLLLKSPNVTFALSQVNQMFFPIGELEETLDNHDIHPTAVISKSAELGNAVKIGANAVIGNNVKIGDGTTIGPNSTIEAKVQIGKNAHIHAQVYIGHSCLVGNSCVIHPNTTIGSEGFGYGHDEKGNHYRMPHYGKVILEDDVHIGANVSMDRGTYEDSIIGYGTKIDNYCHFGHNNVIGRNCLITGGFIGAGTLKIGDNCIIGGRATVKGHLEICSGVTLSGLSGVTGTIDKPGVYGGFPLQKIEDFRRTILSLPALPQMRKSLKKLMKKLEV